MHNAFFIIHLPGNAYERTPLSWFPVRKKCRLKGISHHGWSPLHGDASLAGLTDANFKKTHCPPLESSVRKLLGGSGCVDVPKVCRTIMMVAGTRIRAQSGIAEAPMRPHHHHNAPQVPFRHTADIGGLRAVLVYREGRRPRPGWKKRRRRRQRRLTFFPSKLEVHHLAGWLPPSPKR